MANKSIKRVECSECSKTLWVSSEDAREFFWFICTPCGWKMYLKSERILERSHH